MVHIISSKAFCEKNHITVFLLVHDTESVYFSIPGQQDWMM